MGTHELPTSHNPFEFSSVVKSSGIKAQVEEIIFTPLSLELNRLKDKGALEIQKNGANFRLLPVLSDIYRFIVTDGSKGVSEHITVTERFIEDKAVEVDSKKTISHTWNSQETADRIHELLEIFNQHETRYKQEVLFE